MKLLLRTLGFLLIGLSFQAIAIEPVYRDFFGKAIKGYDTVAYFTQGKATKGDGDFTYEWNGGKWYFSTEQNLQEFIQNPEKYAPQYGGYCAWASSNGYTAKIDQYAWHIHDGKLYLNYSKSVQSTWQNDIPGNIAKADSNWPHLLSGK